MMAKFRGGAADFLLHCIGPLLVAGFLFPDAASANDITHSVSESSIQKSVLFQSFLELFETIVTHLGAVLFYPVPLPLTIAADGTSATIPFIVLWLVSGGIFCTLFLGFVNIRLFPHAVRVIQGRYSSKDCPGEISHFQALSAAVSATVGLGNIAGVAAAVAAGGPGAVVWMVLAGLLGMSTKFAEVTLGHKYRIIDANGRYYGGPFRYLRAGLDEIGWSWLGRVLGILFAIGCLGGALGAGNMFQSNQVVSMMTHTFSSVTELDWMLALAFAVAVGFVLIGGIRRIAHVAEFIVPFMAIVYVTAAAAVLIANAGQVPDAIAFMFRDALSGEAVGGGMIGALIVGIQRAAFSNEAGVGSAPIAHSTARTHEPVREGCVALLEPFIDTVIICFMTGLVITVTGTYTLEGKDGVLLTSAAFATVSPWFPKVLAVCIALFAYSTMITWSYYGEKAWQYLFGPRRLGLSIYHIIFCACVFLGGVTPDFWLILDLSDLLFFLMAIPNLIGVYLLSGILKREVKSYKDRLRQGAFAGNTENAALEGQ